MKLPKIPLAQTVLQLCELKGIKHIVISPGSRNAPLTIGFTNQPFFKCYSIVDERSAAFFALGIAQQLREPVALVCTSGSAMLNYYPAVAEAYYSNIPLVVLSADRPKYLIGIGDGQTIDQKNVYGNHVLYSTNLKEDIDPKLEIDQDDPPIIKNLENRFKTFLDLRKSVQEENENEINKALNIVIRENGPVHINIPFSEPLYDIVDEFDRHLKYEEPVEQLKSDINNELEELASNWNTAKKKMVLVGVNHPNSIDKKWLDNLAEDDSVIVFTETTSNLHHTSFFPSIDKIIAPLIDKDFKQLQPDILLTFGGMVVSKKVKAFLRKYKPKQHWHISEYKANDTFFCLNKQLKKQPNIFFSQFLPKIQPQKSGYQSYWDQIKHRRSEKHKQYINEIPYSDLIVFDEVLKNIPDNTMLQVGNSSAIRYTQLFDVNKTLKVFCNRGTSGIDGCTSTAIGAASVVKEPSVFITGDLGFLYDSNALWNNYLPRNFKIIVINNGGGGIFRILPGNKNTKNFDTFFETKHNMNAKYLSEMYGFEYAKAKNENDLITELNTFFVDSDQPKLLEIFTPRTINDEILLNYFKFIK